MNPGEKWITSKNLEPVEACWRMQSFNVFMFNIDFNLPDMPQIIRRSCGIWFAHCLSFQGAGRWLIRRRIQASREKPAPSCLSAFRIPYPRVQAAADWGQSSAMGFVTKTTVGLQEAGKESLPLLKSKESCNCSAKRIEQRTEEGCRLCCSYWTFSSVAWPFQCGDFPPPPNILLSNKICCLWHWLGDLNPTAYQLGDSVTARQLMALPHQTMSLLKTRTITVLAWAFDWTHRVLQAPVISDLLEPGTIFCLYLLIFC